MRTSHLPVSLLNCPGDDEPSRLGLCQYKSRRQELGRTEEPKREWEGRLSQHLPGQVSQQSGGLNKTTTCERERAGEGAPREHCGNTMRRAEIQCGAPSAP